jgi:hypothetical protein
MKKQKDIGVRSPSQSNKKGAMTLSLITFSITTLCIMTLSITIKNATLIIITLSIMARDNVMLSVVYAGCLN